MNHIIRTNPPLVAEEWERDRMPRRFRNRERQTGATRSPRWAVLVIAMIAATQLWIDAWVLTWLVRHIAPMVWP